MSSQLSVVIPTLNAAQELPALLNTLADGPATDIVVSDGMSRDGTAEIAARRGACVVSGPVGRGAQLARGASAARGNWLLFLHADTRLGAGWAEAVHGFMEAPSNAMRAAVFRFALDDADPRARRIERLVAWRCRAWALPYGDQGLLVSRAFYDSLGGFRPLPLMEDVDLIRRIGRARLAVLDVAAVTSAARYRRDGWLLRPLRNLLCLSLYFAGVPPRAILPLYGGSRR